MHLDFVSAYFQIPEVSKSRKLHGVGSVTLEEPAAAHRSEDHDVSPVHQHQLEVAPAQRPPGPPAVLDHPLLADRVHRPCGPRPGHAARARPRRRRGAGRRAGAAAAFLSRSPARPGRARAPRGARAAASPGRSAARAARPRRPRPGAPGAPPPRSACGGLPANLVVHEPPCSRAGGPNASTSTPASRRAPGSSLSLGTSTSLSRPGVGARLAQRDRRAPGAARHEAGRHRQRAQRAPAPLGAGQHARDQQLERTLELLAGRRLGQVEPLHHRLGRPARLERGVAPRRGRARAARVAEPLGHRGDGSAASSPSVRMPSRSSTPAAPGAPAGCEAARPAAGPGSHAPRAPSPPAAAARLRATPRSGRAACDAKRLGAAPRRAPGRAPAARP